jgi:hypothetical protein
MAGRGQGTREARELAERELVQHAGPMTQYCLDLASPVRLHTRKAGGPVIKDATIAASWNVQAQPA